MIVMSNDFKNSVSATEREMKGYVEVSFVSSADKREFTIDNEPEILQINGTDISDSGLLDDDRKGRNYASLEQDYFLLDGSFVLPNNLANKNPGMGYVSKYTFGEQQEEISEVNPFHFTADAIGCSGITVYFQNNIPLDLEFRVTANNETETFTNITTNNSGVASVTFSERNVTDLYIVVNDILYTNRRLRIQEVDFGLSAIYENDDLISFKTIEQCDRFGFDLPINECEISIGDYDNKFNVQNTNNITNYITKDTIFKPYVGIITSENGIEYCPQGWYWFDTSKWENGIVTFNCKGFLNKLQENVYCVGQLQNSDLERIFGKQIKIWGLYNTGILDVDRNNEYLFKLSSGLENFKKQQIFYSNAITELKNQNLFYSSAYYNLRFVACIKSEAYKIIGREILKKDMEIEKISPIKNITIKEYQYIQKTGSNEIIYETTVQCNGEETLVYDYGKPIGTQTYIIVDNYSNLEILDARNHIYDRNNNLIYTPDYGGTLLEYSYVKVRYNGTLIFRVKETIKYDVQESENVMKFNNEGQEITIDNEMINGTKSRNLSNFLGNYINENISKEKAKLIFNGDPTIELGDTIKAERRFSNIPGVLNYSDIWVTKIESEFNGSFNQTIEGDIIE